MPTESLLLHRTIFVAVICLVFIPPASAQFCDDFSGTTLQRDPRSINGWSFFTGDGSAVMDFSVSGKGYATIHVDATRDRRGIWWALIRRRVSADMDLSLLGNPKHALRIEARIKVSDAPKRVNLHLNTQRTTDFHSHLMEFDIPDTSNWHTISMTTHQFDAVPGDSVYGQLALMDWGLETYRVNIDYFKVNIVNLDSVGPDQGVQVPYHPPIQKPGTMAYHIPVAQNGMVDAEYPQMTFSNWYTRDESGKTDLVTVSGTQFIILRWDLSAFAGKKVKGPGLLELTTHSVQRSADYEKDFGMVRIVEIIGGKPLWNRKDINYATLCQGQPLSRVLNSQMVIDINVSERRGSKTFATIPKPVLQRLIDGKTLGLAIRPLGAVNASFYASSDREVKRGAILHFNLDSKSSTPAEKEH
jgi:hypothetical protein